MQLRPLSSLNAKILQLSSFSWVKNAHYRIRRRATTRITNGETNFSHWPEWSLFFPFPKAGSDDAFAARPSTICIHRRLFQHATTATLATCIVSSNLNPVCSLCWQHFTAADMKTCGHIWKYVSRDVSLIAKSWWIAWNCCELQIVGS